MWGVDSEWGSCGGKLGLVVGHQPNASECAVVARRSRWNPAIWVVGEWGEPGRWWCGT
jgi:hypothetical protein